MRLKFGVPCSKIKDKIKDVDINCTSEEQAMGIAAGCILAGEKPEVYMQNSGLGRIVDVCASLYLPYNIPYPHIILSIRHKPYHHAFMGKITNHILDLLQIKDVEVYEQDI